MQILKFILRYEWLLLIISIFPPVIYSTLFVIYKFEFRVSGYVPTISETGTEYPNTVIMFFFFCFISGSIFWEMLLQAIYILNNYKHSQVSKFFLFLLTCTSSLFFCLISVFPCNVYSELHYLSTFFAFFGIVLYQIIIFSLTHKKTRSFINILRLFSIIMQTLSLLDVACSQILYGLRINVSLSAYGEYSIVLFLPIFFLTYYKEMSKSNTYISFNI